MTNPGKYFRKNVASGLNLIEVAVACGVRKFVFSSTCATYRPPERVPMTEDLPQHPINRSKASARFNSIASLSGWHARRPMADALQSALQSGLINRLVRGP